MSSATAAAAQDPLRVLPALLMSLPRPVLVRFVDRVIERLDELDGDPDMEAEEDWCEAGDDGCAAVFARGNLHWGASHADDGL